jgi:hypothetical protein
MHPKSSATAHLTELPAGSLVLERLPSGEWAWLRPAPRERSYVMPSRYWLTDRGRRALAMEALFGPWPTVSEACAVTEAVA